MSDEIKITEEKTCFCQSKGFRKFLIVATGTFVGAFLALSLFAALHRPPMPAPMPCPCGYQQMMLRHGHGGGHHFDKGQRGDFQKKAIKDRADRKAPVPGNEQPPKPVRGEF